MMRFRWLFTLCLTVLFASTALALDLNEGFVDTAFPPVAWQNLNEGDGANMWYRSTTYPHDTPGHARVAYENLAGGLVAERWLITPKLHVNSVNDTLGFWVRTLYSFVSDNDSLYVRLSTTDSLPSSFTTELGAYKCGSGGDFINVYEMYSYNLATYEGMDIFVAFVHRDEGDSGNEVFIDDVAGPELMAPPNLPTTPDPGDGAVSIPASTNLTWVNGAGTTTIDLYLAQSFDSVDTSDPAARKITTTLTETYDPPSDLDAETLYFWKVVAHNAYGDTEGPVWNFMVAGASLSGSYDIGGGANDYADFTTAVMALYNSGISDAVTFNVYGGDYNEQLRLIGAVPGASADDTIKFRDASGTARLRVTMLLDGQEGVVQMDGASYFVFDGIDIYLDHPNDSTYKCFVMKNGSSYNIVRNATMRGAGYTASTVKYVCYMWGNPSCDYNLFDNLVCTRHNTAFRISGGSSNRHIGNVIRNCAIDDVYYAFYLSYTPGVRIYDNDIQINGPGSSVYGINVYTQASGDTVFVYRNRFHNLTTGGSSSFIRSYGGTGSVLNVYNNFFYDIQTTGTASPYVVLYANSAATTNFDFNSVYINDLASTGSVRAIYMSSSSAILNIRNNIFYSEEATNATDIFYGSSSGYVPTILDYNAYYNNGGADFQVYDVSSDEYATLADLQNNTDYETHGVEGDPGFTSATDLHLLNTNGLCHLNGVAIDGITDDIDGDTRLASPDIGADEYAYLAPSDDYAVRELYGLTWLTGEFAPITTDAWVQNRGSANQTDVKVTLFYDDIPQDSVYVSLNAYESDTVTFNWTTPAAPDTILVKVQSFLAGDAVPENDYATESIRIVSPPMSGTYDIGGATPDYANFTAAIGALTTRGIDAPVIFDVYAETFNESITIGEIDGVTETNTITFQAAGALLTPPEIVGAATTVSLSGADYITFDGIDIQSNTNGRVVEITGDADYNTFKNLSVTGNDVTSSSGYGIYITGGGNDHNVLDNVTVSGAYYAVRFYGSSSTPDVGNELKNSTIAEGKYGVYLYYQDGSSVHHCDIQPGWDGANTEIYGIYGYSHSSGMSSYAYANQIHNIRSQSTCNGIYASTSSGSLIAHNNFVYDWQGPTGTSVMYGLRAYGGTSEWYFNSVYIGDIETTGNIYGFYITGSSTAATLQNNIFQVDEPTEECWGIYVSSGTLTSDYNCFYSSIPGVLYNVGRESSTDYATLALWQGTGHDLNSVEGNPGFIGATDLHISPTIPLVNGVGVDVTGITTDIDDENRGSPPDIGADEYEFTALPHDYSVNRFIDLQPTYVTNIPVVIQAEVQNYGTQNETDVPIRLYYNDVEQDMALLSLTAGQTDTVDLDWTPPVTGFEIGELKAKAFCPGDGFDLNDSTTASVTIVGPPMSGMYDLGGGAMDFANFNEAVTSLSLRGIDGEVIVDCYEGTYAESVSIPQITGATFTDRVIFQAHESELDDIVTLTASSGAVVAFAGADYITFDGIDLTSTGSSDSTAVIRNDADYITLKNLIATGRSNTSTSVKGISIWFDGNDNCTIDNVTIGNATYGIRCYGGSGVIDNLEVMNCLITDAAYGVYLDECSNARVHHNDIQPQSYSTTSSVYGVYLGSTSAADVVYYVYGNRIHNLRQTGTSSSASVRGVYSGSNRTAYVYNNFIWDWQVNGSDCYGLYGGSGTSYFYNNSIRINDLPAADRVAGIYISTGTTTAMNNVIQSDEDVNTCYGIYRYGGTLAASDYNCFYGTGAAFNVGYDGGAYPLLTDWQTAFGRDLNGVTGDPGYIGAADLHIDPVFTLLNAAGTPLAEVTDDIDGDVRGTPPDIGADEYVALVAPDPVTDLVIFPDTPNNDVILTWVASPNANSYKIYAGDAPDFVIEPASQIGHTGSTTFTHEDILLTGEIKVYVVLGSTDAPPAR